MNLLRKVEKNYEILLYITIISIFLSEIKVYIPLFFLHIVYVVFLVIKKEVKFNFNKWNKAVLLFLGWVVLNSIITPFIYKVNLDLVSLIKMFLNFGFAISIIIMIDNRKIKFNRSNFIKLLEVIILINFIQVFVIYLKGNLFKEFISGSLTQSSDAAYVISHYTNIIGVSNKNIWASKLTICYLVYVYISGEKEFFINKIEKIIFVVMGAITIVLLLSRTAQLVLMCPLLYFIIKRTNKLQGKYKVSAYIVFAILGAIGIFIFFDKFFHIKFDMTDGGYTRLYIWTEGIKEFFRRYLIIGGGVGSSTFFIQNTLGRFESNMHNVLINIFFELGVIGGLLYINIIKEFIKRYIRKDNLIKVLMIFILPMAFIMSLQYVGYDNDLLVFLVFIGIINHCKQGRVGSYNG